MSTKNIFVCGYTAKGFRNLLSTNLPSLSRLFILNGGSDAVKSEFMKKIERELTELQYDIECIHSPLNPDALEGILIPKPGVGVINGKLISKSSMDVVNEKHVSKSYTDIVDEKLNAKLGLDVVNSKPTPKSGTNIEHGKLTTKSEAGIINEFSTSKPSDIIAGIPLLHVAQLAAAEALNEYADLEEGFDPDILDAHRQELHNIQNNMQQHFEKAYEEFGKGLKVHDEWEKIYIANMDFLKADQLAKKVIHMLFGETSLNKPGCIRHRFFGGSTPSGPVDYVENITENTAVRYFIKGRPGSGKSTMLKKILTNAAHRGIDAEVYHCGFDPDSLDMLLFPELNLCIFDSTFPHEYYPRREGDSVIDMYAELINADTDELYKDELEDIIMRYRFFTREGTAQLAMAKSCQDELESIYMEAADLKKINNIYDDLCQRIRKSL